jgi:signal transduction histidine kinase
MKIFPFVCLALLPTLVLAQKRGQPLIDSIVDKLPSQQEDTNRVKSLTKIAETYIQVNPAKGIGYAKNGLAIAESLQWKKGIAKLNNAMGLLIGDTGNNTLARTYFERSYALNKELGASFSMISNLNNIGRGYQRESDYPKALDYFLKALAIAEEIKSDEQKALVGTNITSSYFTQGNLVKAQEYAEMTLKYGQLSHTPNNIGKALLQLGVIKSETRDTASAKVYMQQALKVYEEMDNKPAIVQVLVSMASLEYPDYEKVIAQMRKAQAILEEIGPSSLLSVGNLANLGRACYDLSIHSKPPKKEEWMDNAVAYLDRGMQLARETNNAEFMATISQNLSDVEAERGHYKAALDHFKSFYSINDSLFSQDKKNELAGLESRHQIDLKDKEIAISKLNLINQRRMVITLIAGMVLLAVIGGLLFRQNRMRKKSNTTLMVLNNELDEANKVKLKFFGILSHDLRAPVASLVNYLHLLKNDPGLLATEDRAVHQEQMSQSTEDLLQTMETMLLWSKEQMENFKPDIRMVAVRDLFDHLQKFFAQTPDIRISFLDAGALALRADENYLKVIMQNLTSNAIKALRNKPGAYIEWKATQERGQTVLSVTDNGPGIAADEAKALYNEGDVVNTKTGFGFHLIRDLAKAIRLRISIVSAPGKGTTFTLSA